MKRILLIWVLSAFIFVPIFSQELPTDIPEANLQSNPIEAPQEDEESTNRESGIELNLIKRDAPYRVTLSPTILYTSPTPTYSSPINVDGKYGMGIGAMCNLRLGRRNKSSRGGTGKIAFDLGLFYTFSDYKTKVYYLGENHEEKMKIQWLQIPLTFQVYPWKGIFIEAGAAYTRVIKATPEYLSLNEYERLDLSAMRSSDIKVVLGFGYDIDHCTAGFRYLIPTSALAENFNTKIIEWQVFLRYNFKIVNR